MFFNRKGRGTYIYLISGCHLTTKPFQLLINQKSEKQVHLQFSNGSKLQWWEFTIQLRHERREWCQKVWWTSVSRRYHVGSSNHPMNDSTSNMLPHHLKTWSLIYRSSMDLLTIKWSRKYSMLLKLLASFRWWTMVCH